MKQCAIVAALSIALPATAQEWHFELSNPVLSPANPSTTVTLSVDPGPGAFAFRGANFSAHATEAGWSDPESLLEGPGQDPGVISGPSVLGISLQQYCDLFCPPGWEPLPGIVDVWRATFTITDFTAREIDLSTETLRFEVYIPGPGHPVPWLTESRLAELREGAVGIQVIPGPGALALLGFFAAFARRRRPSIAEPRPPRARPATS